jgi:MoxR-like ATPase
MAETLAAVGSPAFEHRAAVRRALDTLFATFQLGSDHGEMRLAMGAALLVKNATLLLTGTYGTGKTQFVQLVKKLLFSDGNGGFEFDYETCHQELTAFDVLYHLDLAELQKGREVVHPKKMVTARLKFLNEIQRANAGFFNALLPLLSEQRVTYRDADFETPDYLCIMDRNPLDTGSSEIPEAFLDRIDFDFEVPAIHLGEHLRLQQLRRRADGFEWGSLDRAVEPAMTFAQLVEVWRDVSRVDIGRRATLLSGLIGDTFRLCIYTERSTTRMEYDLPCAECELRAEICGHLLKVPGQRFVNAMLRLSQALAWLEGRAEVTEEDLFRALPWTLSHRLAMRPEELRKAPSVLAWLRDTAVRDILRPRSAAIWADGLRAYEARDVSAFERMPKPDLAIGMLKEQLESEMDGGS